MAGDGDAKSMSGSIRTDVTYPTRPRVSEFVGLVDHEPGEIAVFAPGGGAARASWR